VTQVVGLLEPPLLILLAVGTGLVATTVMIVLTARHRSRYREGEALAARAAVPLFSIPPISASISDHDLDLDQSIDASIDDHDLHLPTPTPLWPPTPATAPWSALDPVIELEAPGPGVLGRVRRRPLADTATPRHPFRVLEDATSPATGPSRVRPAANSGRAASSHKRARPAPSAAKK